MKRLLVLSVFVLTAVGQDVQHAPTVAQCQADQRLWLSEIEEHGDSPRLPKFLEVDERRLEMLACKAVDPENRWRYYNTAAEIESLQEHRLNDFIARHDMWQKFLDEDAAGKR
jgi:hypothetical protein